MPISNYAIVAHYDPDGSKSQNWDLLLTSLLTVCSQGVIVSTGITDHDAQVAKNKGFSVITRQNIGYDFMSYSVGAMYSKNIALGKKRIFCNDSFYIADSELFNATLKKLVATETDATFLTYSNQIQGHGQSYCFAISPNIFNRYSFQNFLKSIRPKAQKMEIIYTYEFGLTNLLKEMGATISGLNFGSAILSDKQKTDKINPTQHKADYFLKKYGFIKFERLLKNPNNHKNTQTIDSLFKNLQLKNTTSLNKIKKQKPVAIVICHCHYIEVVDELIERFNYLPDGCEIYITSSNDAVLTLFKIKWQRKNIQLHVYSVENWGRDVRPFNYIVKKLQLPNDIPILKIHGKRSLYSPNGDSWRRDSLYSLLPNEQKIESYIKAFSETQNLAMLGPPLSYISNEDYWGSNKSLVKNILKEHSYELNDSDLGFYAGTMFWIRSQCASLALAHVKPENFEKEAGQRDGTYAHALERAIPMILRKKNWKLLEIDNNTELTPEYTVNRKITYY